MKTLYLIKIGEMTLKKGNIGFFERTLRNNIKHNLKPYPVKVTNRTGRFYLETKDVPEEFVIDRLSKTFGIVGFYKTFAIEKNMKDIRAAAVKIARQNIEAGRGSIFKAAARRADKSFPLDSYHIQAEAGEAVLEEFPNLTVKMKNVDWEIAIEIREKAYVYGFGYKGPGGLPVGTAGRGLLLLSGGIDSPVAGYLMAKRGIKLDAIYFDTPPYTSIESKDKVSQLATIMAPWLGGFALCTVPFTKAQLFVRKNAIQSKTTLHSRAAMMKLAEIQAIKRGSGCLITGESLSQVASQTMESLHYTNSIPGLPVFRPLIGLDKEEIIKIAQKIGTYETSILPFDDCCSLFAPEHPQVYPNFEETTKEFQAMDLEEILKEATEETEYKAFRTFKEEDTKDKGLEK